MIGKNRIRNQRLIVLVQVAFFITLSFAGCFKKPAWEAKNTKLIQELKLQKRIRADIPKSKVVSNLEAGIVTNIGKLPLTEIAPGAKARLY